MKNNYRKILQIFFFVLAGMIAINHSLASTGIKIPFISNGSLHALCPFGGVETLISLLTFGVFVKKIHMSSLVLMAIIFILALLFGGVFCGWICPLGTVQEWMGKLGKKIFKKKYNTLIPRDLDSVLKYGRYLILAYVLYGTTMSLKLVFESFDPYYTLYNFWTGEVGIVALVFLITLMMGSLFIERPWCKYFCPYGAVLGLFNKIRIFKIQRNLETCINCKKCDNACPMNISVSTKKTITDTRCISCLKCTSENVCPVEDTVEVKA